jgi:hypothetical protein
MLYQVVGGSTRSIANTAIGALTGISCRPS